VSGPQLCVNCGVQAGYPHRVDCSSVRYNGEPDKTREDAIRALSRAAISSGQLRLAKIVNAVAVVSMYDDDEVAALTAWCDKRAACDAATNQDQRTWRALAGLLTGDPADEIVERIDNFNTKCQEAEYTDTGEAWDLLRLIRDRLA